MPKFPILNVLLLLAVASGISGCSFWSGPWPRVTLNTVGLGTSPLADYIRKHSYLSANDLKGAVREFLMEQTSAKGISREDAEALGMQCAPAPSKECVYSGELWFQDDQRYVRRDSPQYGTRTIRHVEVRLSYLKPHNVVVQADEHYVPDE